MPVSYCRPLGQNKIRYINIAILFFLKGILLYRKNSLCPKGKQYKNISIKRAFRLLDWNYHNLELWKIPRMINSSSQSERLRGLFPSGSLQEIKGGLSKQGWLREGAISEPISEADSVTAPDLPNQPADSASRGAAGEPRLHPALLPPTHILHVAAQTWTPTSDRGVTQATVLLAPPGKSFPDRPCRARKQGGWREEKKGVPFLNAFFLADSPPTN